MKTQPVATPLTLPYWEGCAAGELRLQWCGACERHQFYPRSVCAECLGPVDWVAASGQGRVETWTVVRHPVGEAYADDVPYVVALIHLAEGPRMMSIVRGPVDQIVTGTDVEVCYESWGEDFTVPVFKALLSTR